MKNKASLSLIEQVIMILVFALSAAVSLRVFAYAEKLSEEKTDLDLAVLWAQNAAEAITAAAGDYVKAAEYLDAGVTEEGFEKNIEYENGSITVTAKAAEGTPLLGSACIIVYRDTEELYTLRVCWQEAEK